MSLLSKAAGERAQGAVQGVAGSSGAIASVLGLILGGLLYGGIGGDVFLASGAVVVVVSVVALPILVRGRRQKSS